VLKSRDSQKWIDHSRGTVLTDFYTVLRARSDGSYLAAQPQPQQRYLLLFGDATDGLTYLNTHAPDVREQFATESVAATQLNGVMQRWGFQGLALVRDPILPMMDFLARQT
jgi:hypothetical protein